MKTDSKRPYQLGLDLKTTPRGKTTLLSFYRSNEDRHSYGSGPIISTQLGVMMTALQKLGIESHPIPSGFNTNTYFLNVKGEANVDALLAYSRQAKIIAAYSQKGDAGPDGMVAGPISAETRPASSQDKGVA